MTKEEHKEEHKRLHRCLDSLIADFILHHKDKRPSNTTVMELMGWSHQQTIDPIPVSNTKHDEEKK